MQINKTTPNNKLAITLKMEHTGNRLAISEDGNAIKKDANTTLIYKDLTIETQHMWNVKTKVTPLIIRA